MKQLECVLGRGKKKERTERKEEERTRLENKIIRGKDTKNLHNLKHGLAEARRRSRLSISAWGTLLYFIFCPCSLLLNLNVLSDWMAESTKRRKKKAKWQWERERETKIRVRATSEKVGWLDLFRDRWARWEEKFSLVSIKKRKQRICGFLIVAIHRSRGSFWV